MSSLLRPKIQSKLTAATSVRWRRPRSKTPSGWRAENEHKSLRGTASSYAGHRELSTSSQHCLDDRLGRSSARRLYYGRSRKVNGDRSTAGSELDDVTSSFAFLVDHQYGGEPIMTEAHQKRILSAWSESGYNERLKAIDRMSLPLLRLLMMDAWSFIDDETMMTALVHRLSKETVRDLCGVGVVCVCVCVCSCQCVKMHACLH